MWPMDKWERRDAKEKAKKRRMPKHGRSVFLLLRLERERSEKAKKDAEKEKEK